ncbi:MAG: CofH family radical SAM protein [Candidatus Melainabacteria bacterium]|nr:CofH family radical SAM protein [Candidatus Melainabacteria bacterium]
MAVQSKLKTNSSFFVDELASSSHNLSKIAAKILASERISYDEGVELIRSNDLFLLGHMANFVRERKAYETALARGFDEATARARMTQVWWNTNLHLNPTNVCIGTCDFCSFARRPNDQGAYTMSIAEALDRVAIARSEGATEVHIVGGLNPKTLVEYYSDLIRAIKQEAPGIHVKAFTAVEIEFFAKFSKTSYKEVLQALMDAGLDSMPGGGAEIFSRQVRDEMCPDKIDAETWLEIHQTAHELGLRTNATMLAGIGEEPEERIEHLDLLRQAQDKSGGWQTFIPLSCHYEGNDLLERGVKPLTGYDQLKNIALSRIMLDNFDNIKAYWIQLGEKMAQIALSFGANDLDGTVKAERITRAAGASKRSLAEDTLTNLIEGAGLTAIERDTIYNPIEMSAHKI